MEDDGTLSIGTRLGEFEIRSLVDIGGVGIVYRAFDHDLEREVAIKEYMPRLLASRTVDGQVQARDSTHIEAFEAGRRRFMLEAKMLARFDHPALVKVFRFWEDNGTACMVMPLYTGQTLAHMLKQLPTPPTEAWLMGVLVPLLGALEALHSQQIFHCNVSPDNILLLRNGRPVLLGFGTPIEQCAEGADLPQGPWTDLYALGAVVYTSLTGKPPPPAAARTVQDDLVPLTDVAARLQAERGLRYSAPFLDAWQQALAVRPNERPQSVQALMQRLGLMPASASAMPDSNTPLVTPRGEWSEVRRDSDPAPSRPPPSKPVASAEVLTPLETPPPHAAHGLTAVALAGLLSAGVLGYLMTRPVPVPEAPTAAGPAVVASTPASSQTQPPPPPIIDEAPERVSSKAAEAAASKAALAAVKASAAAAKAAAQASAAAARLPRSPALLGSSTNANAETSNPRPATQAPRPLPTPAPAPAPARTLDDLCGKRLFIARDLCIQDACLTPEFSNSATCTDLRRKAEDERIRKLHTDG